MATHQWILTPAMPAIYCHGSRLEAMIVHVDDDQNRTRIMAKCPVCHHDTLVTYAKRRNDEGREVWGPVGLWVQTVNGEGDMSASNPMHHEPPVVPCETCGRPSTNPTALGVKRCNDCREVETRLTDYVKRGGEKAYMRMINALADAYPDKGDAPWYLAKKEG